MCLRLSWVQLSSPLLFFICSLLLKHIPTHMVSVPNTNTWTVHASDECAALRRWRHLYSSVSLNAAVWKLMPWMHKIKAWPWAASHSSNLAVSMKLSNYIPKQNTQLITDYIWRDEAGSAHTQEDSGAGPPDLSIHEACYPRQSLVSAA